MRYPFDYFVSKITCPGCGRMSEEDDSTKIATAIQREPRHESIGLGEVVDVAANIDERGYHALRPYRCGEPLVLAETWECHGCGSSTNWVLIVIANGRVMSIQGVGSGSVAVECAHYLSDDGIDVLSRASGWPYESLIECISADILRSHHAWLLQRDCPQLCRQKPSLFLS